MKAEGTHSRAWQAGRRHRRQVGSAGGMHKPKTPAPSASGPATASTSSITHAAHCTSGWVVSCAYSASRCASFNFLLSSMPTMVTCCGTTQAAATTGPAQEEWCMPVQSSRRCGRPLLSVEGGRERWWAAGLAALATDHIDSASLAHLPEGRVPPHPRQPHGQNLAATAPPQAPGSAPPPWLWPWALPLPQLLPLALLPRPAPAPLLLLPPSFVAAWHRAAPAPPPTACLPPPSPGGRSGAWRAARQLLRSWLGPPGPGAGAGGAEAGWQL